MVSNNFINKNRDRKSAQQDHLPVWRIYFLLGIILLGCFAIVFRLYGLQVNSYDFYKDLADNQHKLREKILPKRGEIFLQEKGDLFPAAVNKEMMTVFAVPREIEPEKKGELVDRLSKILSIDRDEIQGKISKENDMYEILKKRLSDSEEIEIKNLNKKGIYLNSEDSRYYPGGSLGAQLIGFVGSTGDSVEGRYGLEKFFENELRGSSGILEQERDTGGRWISIGQKSLTPAKDGDDIILSIDHVIQFKAELALKNAVQRHKADGGKIVIAEPYSGKILAMASYPTFNLNEFSKVEDMSLFKNTTISNEFECGSVFKTFTMAAGLDTGVVSPDTTYVDTGTVNEAGFTIMNSDNKSNGVQTMTNVIEKSLNTGVIFVEKNVGNSRFLQYIKNFGFGKKTGIELPGETSGNLTNLDSGRNIEYFTASFGQGITVTPLQLTMAYAAIANGGELVRPQIIDYIRNTVGGEQKIEREVERRVISKDTANKVALMLESNVLRGHGKLAGVPGYRVGGKTGTAQIPDKEKGGYRDDATIGSFAGFAPIDNPQFAMIVVIDYPKDVQWAESTAGPVFGEMSKFLFDYMGIEPTEDYSQADLEKFTRTHNYINTEEESESAETTTQTIEEKKEDKDNDKKKDKKKKD